jgi:hypothetical protein
VELDYASLEEAHQAREHFTSLSSFLDLYYQGTRSPCSCACCVSCAVAYVVCCVVCVVECMCGGAYFVCSARADRRPQEPRCCRRRRTSMT